MTHKEFQTAGKKPGLQVWRVEKMDLVPVPHELHGSFFTGDAYILLYTTAAPSYNVHSWIGTEATQDESTAAVIFQVQLDDFLNGTPVQYNEFQNEESSTFMKYFKTGIKYKKGGVRSGFKHVVEENVKRALHVKGRRLIRGTEVSLEWASFNKGDCFIIDLGKDIFLWSGSESNRYERLKAIQMANDIRDNERNGRADVEIVDEGCEPEAIISVMGPKPELPSGTCDVSAEKKKKNQASLYMISDAADSMKTTLVAEKNPFKQNMLSQSECYILDNGADRKVFVWKGKDANEAERKSAVDIANTFIKDHGYSPRTQIQVFPAGSESTLFKQFFSGWFEGDIKGPHKVSSIGSIASVKQIPFDASKLHDNKEMAAQHGMVDDGSGKVQIWRVEGGDKVPVDASTHGQFFGGDCYLVLYSYNEGRQRHIIYIWQGLKCTQDELAASAFLAVNLDDSMGGIATQVRVTQGQEPSHFASIFKGNLIIHLGGTSRCGGESAPSSTRLFHIRKSSTKATRAVEVEPSASSLNTNDVFVLKSSDAHFEWKGKGATEEEIATAKHLTKLIGGAATEVEETKEPPAFWAVLGGKKEYQTSKALQSAIRPPRLFGCSNKTGNLIAEEVPGDFTQIDLATDDVMILDTWDQLFVWIGKDANETEKTGSFDIAKEYVNSDPSGRRGIPITTIKQGEEPFTFTGWFQAWDPKMWEKDLLQCMQQQMKK
ncbi:scinderin like a [Stegastes partitus]|uniref:Gelsolin-like n=1 Tax=Stegastes partitus TaxID=144197 RepID=A0A3B4ZVM1_9TELE|nr:PREDICTED: gelsolin-like [Stegastes partitus]XP_008295313.1 PREDICTED: gelsolin-like [Stegastes partitus]